MKQFIYPYIMYKDTRKAVEYYIKNLGGEITYTMYGKDDPNCPPGREDEVWHLQYKLKDHQFYMADQELEDKGRIHLHLDYEDVDEMTEHFNNMKQESTVIQDLGKTYWGAIFGTLKDPFGVTWQFHYSLPQDG